MELIPLVLVEEPFTALVEGIMSLYLSSISHKVDLV